MIARVKLYIACSVCGTELDADCTTFGEILAHPCGHCEARRELTKQMEALTPEEQAELDRLVKG